MGPNDRVTISQYIYLHGVQIDASVRMNDGRVSLTINLGDSTLTFYGTWEELVNLTYAIAEAAITLPLVDVPCES